MRPFEELVAEAEAADVTGWGFGWLDGRATEERSPWGYAGLLARRLAEVTSAVDIDTGGGELLAEMPTLPPTMVATEAWPPNAEKARRLIGPRGVRVVENDDGAPLPLPDGGFQLVISRHPVRPDFPEIARVLAPGGHYLAQHVGPDSARELSEYFLGPLPDEPGARHPDREAAAAEAAGLEVLSIRRARCRMELYDVGAVVWTLRKCVWWVPGFTAGAYRDQLRRLDARLRGGRAFVAHSTRHLIEARRPA